MAKYSVELNRTASTTASLGTIGADATRPRRGKLYDIILGSEASPADNAFKYTVQRCTALGTSTGVTPTALDPANAATEADAGENHTIEPTYTAGAVLLAIGLNQRATFRWVAAPGGELVYPATAANGLGVQTPSASTVAITATLHFEEQ
jgi:hypothetical protein